MVLVITRRKRESRDDVLFAGRPPGRRPIEGYLQGRLRKKPRRRVLYLFTYFFSLYFALETVTAAEDDQRMITGAAGVATSNQ
jgi:hypothetical protein